MSDTPNVSPHEVYVVTFRSLDGSEKMRRVITNRGQAKAVFLATRAETGLLHRRDFLDVEVVSEGPPDVDAHGMPVLAGLGFDRNEW